MTILKHILHLRISSYRVALIESDLQCIQGKLYILPCKRESMLTTLALLAPLKCCLKVYTLSSVLNADNNFVLQLEKYKNL